MENKNYNELLLKIGLLAISSWGASIIAAYLIYTNNLSNSKNFSNILLIQAAFAPSLLILNEILIPTNLNKYKNWKLLFIISIISVLTTYAITNNHGLVTEQSFLAYMGTASLISIVFSGLYVRNFLLAIKTNNINKKLVVAAGSIPGICNIFFALILTKIDNKLSLTAPEWVAYGFSYITLPPFTQWVLLEIIKNHNNIHIDKIKINKITSINLINTILFAAIASLLIAYHATELLNLRHELIKHMSTNSVLVLYGLNILTTALFVSGKAASISDKKNSLKVLGIEAIAVVILVAIKILGNTNPIINYILTTVSLMVTVDFMRKISGILERKYK